MTKVLPLQPADYNLEALDKSGSGLSHSWTQTPRMHLNLCEALKPAVVIQPSASKEPEKGSNQNQLWGHQILNSLKIYWKSKSKEKVSWLSPIRGPLCTSLSSQCITECQMSWAPGLPPAPLARDSSSACHCQDTVAKLPLTFPSLFYPTYNTPACFSGAVQHFSFPLHYPSRHRTTTQQGTLIYSAVLSGSAACYLMWLMANQHKHTNLVRIRWPRTGGENPVT